MQDSHSKPVAGKGKTVAIVYAQWNKTVIDALVSGARSELESSGAEVILQEVSNATDEFRNTPQPGASSLECATNAIRTIVSLRYLVVMNCPSVQSASFKGRNLMQSFALGA